VDDFHPALQRVIGEVNPEIDPRGPAADLQGKVYFDLRRAATPRRTQRRDRPARAALPLRSRVTELLKSNAKITT